MFQLGGLESIIRLEHRHDDGTWATFEPRPIHHDPADHDPERDWANGRIYVCATCNEEIRVADVAGEGGPAKP
ncbi:MAG: hypothetical protein HY262_06490 [Chloroflexi bacterium]|nr:hypothetical protein [Chloroflexota bacterium]